MDRNPPVETSSVRVSLSLSARRAWIEIQISVSTVVGVLAVALRKESVDRNCSLFRCRIRPPVVALRKESVDRNEWIKAKYPGCRLSLSARRAWIEIKSGLHPLMASLVALRKESVDRNTSPRSINSMTHMSLSARRAWIEIQRAAQWVLPSRPSLSARRAWIEIDHCHSGQNQLESLSARRAWIEISMLCSVVKC